MNLCHLIFFFNDTATSEIYTLSLHDALPILAFTVWDEVAFGPANLGWPTHEIARQVRSEEHTSELQSRRDLVCRLLLEKKKETQSCWNETLKIICAEEPSDLYGHV